MKSENGRHEAGLRVLAGRYRLLPGLAMLAGTFVLAAFAGSEWPQFRGPNCAGVSESDTPPISFGPKSNLLWRIALPGGLSSPCIWHERVFVTVFENQQLETICIRRDTGEILWRRAAPAPKIESTNPWSSPASGTPATDGKRVCAYFGSFGVLAYDFEGRELWRRPLPIPKLPNGSGTSPALMEGNLVINRDQEDGKSTLLALDASTGETVWETPRPDFAGSYSTPVLWQRGPVSEVVLAGSFRIVGYDLKTGQERWSAHGLEALSVCPTPVLGDGQLYAMSYSFGGAPLPTFVQMSTEADRNKDGRIAREEARGFLASVFDIVDTDKDALVTEREWNASVAALRKGEHGVFAVRAPRTGDVTLTHIVWRQKRGAATVPSPLFYRGRLYVVQDGGRVTCYEAATGRPVYEQERLDAPGEYHASPVAANGKIYFASARGTVSVIEAGDEMKVLARNNLAERIAATPAIADDTLYIRTANHLWVFGEKR